MFLSKQIHFFLAQTAFFAPLLLFFFIPEKFNQQYFWYTFNIYRK